jgi:predicted flap endonuclease-1-like 5' DNA nuclease
MADIADIEGVGPAFAQKLKEAGVGTVEALLREGGSPQGRQRLAAQTGIRADLLLRWVNHADLFRIKGVAGEFSELLEAGGVDSVPELARRSAENLHERLVAVNAEKKVSRRVPTVNQLTDWIAEAKTLPRAVTH